MIAIVSGIICDNNIMVIIMTCSDAIPGYYHNRGSFWTRRETNIALLTRGTNYFLTQLTKTDDASLRRKTTQKRTGNHPDKLTILMEAGCM